MLKTGNEIDEYKTPVIRHMKNYILLLLLTASVTVAAQTNPAPETIPDSSAQSKKKKTWIKPAIAVAYSGLVLACYKKWDPKIQQASQKNTSGVKELAARAVSDFGMGQFHTVSLVSTSVVALVSGNQRLRKTVIIWSGSLLINTVSTYLLKTGFQRHRPSSGSNHRTFDGVAGTEQHTSLPSAHTSNAFTTATVFATLYKDEKWVAPAAYGLAALVGLSRIHDNAHWTSDVLAGAAVGFLSAKAMTGLYNLASKRLMIIPQVGRQYAVMTILYPF